MSDELNKTLLNILKDVQVMVRENRYTDGETVRIDPELGICNTVVRGTQSPEVRIKCLNLLSDLMEKWPEFSGDSAYPVPHPDKDPERAFDLASTEEMWNPGSVYGAARLRLLDWLIARLEAETETRKETQNDRP